MEDNNIKLRKYLIEKIDTVREIGLNCGGVDWAFFNGKLEAYIEIYEFLLKQEEYNVSI